MLYSHKGSVSRLTCSVFLIDLPRLFPTFDKDQLAKFIETARKNALKLVNSPSLRDILETSDDIAPQSREILHSIVWWGHKLATHHTNVYKIVRLRGAISLLVFILSLSKWATLLILRRSFQQDPCEKLKKP